MFRLVYQTLLCGLLLVSIKHNAKYESLQSRNQYFYCHQKHLLLSVFTAHLLALADPAKNDYS